MFNGALTLFDIGYLIVLPSIELLLFLPSIILFKLHGPIAYTVVLIAILLMLFAPDMWYANMD